MRTHSKRLNGWVGQAQAQTQTQTQTDTHTHTHITVPSRTVTFLFTACRSLPGIQEAAAAAMTALGSRPRPASPAPGTTTSPPPG